MSLEDQIVDRWLFTPWFELEVQNHSEIPNKTGFSILPSGYTAVPREFGHSVLATDFSSYDWTYPAWLVEDVLQSRRDQYSRYHGNPDFEAYWRAVETRFSQVLGPNCRVDMPDGTRLFQTVWGIMKSGWLLTLSVNGQGVQILVAAAWRDCYPKEPLPLLWTMGDDMLMRWPAGLDSAPLVARLNELGVIVKVASREREFAGFRFGELTVEPSYTSKHEFVWCHTPPDELVELANAYSLVYPLSEHPFAHLLREHQTLTPQLLRYWALGLYDGELFATPRPHQWASMIVDSMAAC